MNRDICYCATPCENTDCERNECHVKKGFYSIANLGGTEYCPGQIPPGRTNVTATQ